MTEKERIDLIRKGNDLFNQGKIEEAAKIFLATNYIDGLVRVGDHYYYEQKRIFKAFFYYKKANYKKRLDEIYEKMAKIIHLFLEEDKNRSFEEMHENTQTNTSTIVQSVSPQDKDTFVKKYQFPKLEK